MSRPRRDDPRRHAENRVRTLKPTDPIRRAVLPPHLKNPPPPPAAEVHFHCDFEDAP